MTEPIRLLVADDHAVVRRGLVLVLGQTSDFVVVAEVTDGSEVVEAARRTRPDLALLDWKMPRLDGLAAARALKQSVPAVRTLLLTGAPIEAAVLDALDLGVDGAVHKDISPDGLEHAVRVVAGGQTFLGAEIAAALLARSRRGRPTDRPALSPREIEVLALMATPATYREIAAALGVGETTVRTHVKRLLAKLGQPNRTQGVIAALRHGLISLDPEP